jgi:hypothetical protein
MSKRYRPTSGAKKRYTPGARRQGQRVRKFVIEAAKSYKPKLVWRPKLRLVTPTLSGLTELKVQPMVHMSFPVPYAPRLSFSH